MNRSSLLMSSAVCALVVAGLASGCSDTTYHLVYDDPAGAAGTAGSVGVAGTPSAGAGEAGEQEAGGAPSAAGAAREESQAGEAGAEAGGTGGTAGSSGSAGTGGTLAGSGGTAGSAGSAGKAGGGGTAGSGGTSGSAGSAGKGGTGGTAGTAGSSGSAGSGGAVQALFLPASATCAAGNVQAAFSICRNCHVAGGAGPFLLVTLQDIVPHAADITTAVTNNTMPKQGQLTAPNKATMLSWLAAGAVGVPNASCP